MRGYAAHTTRMGRMGRGYAAHTTRQRRSMERLYIGRRYFIRAEYGGGAISYAPPAPGYRCRDTPGALFCIAHMLKRQHKVMS